MVVVHGYQPPPTAMSCGLRYISLVGPKAEKRDEKFPVIVLGTTTGSKSKVSETSLPAAIWPRSWRSRMWLAQSPRQRHGLNSRIVHLPERYLRKGMAV